MRRACPLCHDLEDGALARLYTIDVVSDVRRRAHAVAALEAGFAQAVAHGEMAQAAHLLTEGGLANHLVRACRYVELRVVARRLARDLMGSVEGRHVEPILCLIQAEVLRWIGCDYRLAIDALEHVSRGLLSPTWETRRQRVQAEALLYVDRSLAVERLQEVARNDNPATIDDALVAQSGISAALLHSKRPEAALGGSLSALECARQCDSSAGVEEHTDRAAAALVDLGVFAPALELEREALVLSARRGNRRGLCYRYRLLAEILAHLDDKEGALALFLLAQDMSRSMGDPNIHLVLDLEQRLRHLMGHDVFETTRAEVVIGFRTTLKQAMDHVFAGA